MEKEYSLSICGNECTIISSNDEEQVLEIAKEVENRIKAIYTDNPRISVALAAILTSMDFCEEIIDCKIATDNLRGQVKTYLDDAAKAIIERDEAMREVEKIKREIEILRSHYGTRE